MLVRFDFIFVGFDVERSKEDCHAICGVTTLCLEVFWWCVFVFWSSQRKEWS